MTACRPRRRADLHRRGLAPKTPPGDLDAVHHLAHHDRRAPDPLSAAALRPDVRCLRTAPQVAASPVRMPLEGIRFCSARPRQRPWPVFDRVRPRQRHTRPVVWRPQAVRHRRALVAPPHARRCRRTLEACGRRRRAGTPLQVGDSDAQRRLGRVDQGQGGPARVVPRPPPDPRVVAGVLAARAAPPLGVPGPAPADGLLPAVPPPDVHRGGAPAGDGPSGLHPDAAARRCHSPRGTGGGAAGQARTAGPPEPEDHRPLDAVDAPALRPRARPQHRSQCGARRVPAPTHA
jgi:hypothetical protein